MDQAIISETDEIGKISLNWAMCGKRLNQGHLDVPKLLKLDPYKLKDVNVLRITGEYVE